jgi:hypothetical protein
MLKSMSSVDEIEEQHKQNGNVLNKKEQKVIEDKKKESEKIIDPKYIFDKKPKQIKKQKKVQFRTPTIDNKNMKPIKEYGY